MTTKTCTGCHNERPLSDFYARSGTQGLRMPCKVCRRRQALAKAHKQDYKRYSNYSVACEQVERIYGSEMLDTFLAGRKPGLYGIACLYCGKQADLWEWPSDKPEHWLEVKAVCTECAR